MKCYILTEGGRKIGFGHLTRCLSLYQAFEELGVASKFIVNGDKYINDVLNGRDYATLDWIRRAKEVFKLITKNDIVIIDSYLAEYNFYKHVSGLTEKVIYIDDNLRISYPRGYVVNGTILAEEFNYPSNAEIQYLLGTKYMPLRKEFWDVPQKAIKDVIESVMITFGGDDFRNLTPKVMNYFNRNHGSLKLNVIIGTGFSEEGIKEIEKIKKSNTNIHYSLNAEEIKNIMIQSDIAISAGGQTLYELARVGVPTIAVMVVDNQRNNVKGWQSVGFIKYVEYKDDMNIINDINNSFNDLIDMDKRKKMAKQGQSFVDGKGAVRVVEKIINKENEGYKWNLKKI